jgi:hypothetical protein
MTEIHELSKGWDALEIKGRGVIVKTGSGPLFIEDVTIVDGELVGLTYDEVKASITPAKKPGPSSIAAVNLKAFEEEVSRRNLSAGGEYGVSGALVAKLRERIKTMTPETSSAIGNLLALGDHDKYGSVAVVIGMAPARQEEFAKVLDGDADALEDFVDECIVGAA